MPGDLGVPVVTTLVCFVSHLQARLRVQRAPGIPHALCFSGRLLHAKLGRIAPRGCGSVFANRISNRHRPRRRVIQYSETLVMESKSRGVLDTRMRGV
jgi:hypothetical protein